MYRVLSITMSFVVISGGLLHAHDEKNQAAGNHAPALSGAVAYAPISIGEMIDKITILRIKASRFFDETKRFNVMTELRALECVLTDLLPSDNRDLQECADLTAQLQSINEMLWEIEDAIRAKEAEGCFDGEFIALARSVYVTNDERGRVKKALNNLLHSALTEEKTYTSYVAQ